MSYSSFTSRRLFKGLGAAGFLMGTLHLNKTDQERRAKASPREEEIVEGYLGAVGNTPLIELKSLSRITGCRILAKADHLNPSGSVKDRAAVYLIHDAESKGLLKPGGVIIEGTGGNTGLGLALAAMAKGYKCIFAVPENISKDKIELMKAYRAEVHLQPCVPFSDQRHYYHTAARLASEREGAFFTNQFENLSNMRAHFEGTGPEIWKQTGGKVDAFVCAAGTGGTIGGVSIYLKRKNPRIKVFLIDPPGSSLASYINKGQLAPSPGNSIAEGIGIGRLTNNFKAASIDEAFIGSDREIIDMALYLLEKEGLFIGPSAALNVVGACKVAGKLGPGHTIVTVLCDGGERYRHHVYNDATLKAKGLLPSNGPLKIQGLPLPTEASEDGCVIEDESERIDRRSVIGRQ